MAAGIVRRIDELGRIVIPKEFRRTMRLKEGDEMEILSSGECITLKKYSGYESVINTVRAVASLLARSVGSDVLFVSSEGVEVAEGKNKKLYTGAHFSDEFANIVRERRARILQKDDLKGMFKSAECEAGYCVLEPVVVAGDLVGAALMLCDSLPDETAKSYMNFCVRLIEAALQ